MNSEGFVGYVGRDYLPAKRFSTRRPAPPVVEKNSSLATKPHEEQQPLPRGSIRISYGGNLSTEIDWNKKLLDKFAEVVDLRTTITVADSSKGENPSYTQLGDTLALKRTMLPDRLKPTQKAKNFYEISFDEKAGTGKVVLLDQQITSAVMKANKGKFDKAKFAAELHKQVKAGLNDILFYEKIFQFKQSGIADVISFAEFFAIACSLYPGGFLFIDGMKNIITTNNTIPSTLENFEGTILMAPSMLAIMFKLKAIMSEKQASIFYKTNPRYINGKDYVVSKHVRDFAKGLWMLHASKDPIVKLSAK